MGTDSFLFARSFITISLPLQRLVNAVSNSNIDEVVAILTTGIDINLTLKVLLQIAIFCAQSVHGFSQRSM